MMIEILSCRPERHSPENARHEDVVMPRRSNRLRTQRRGAMLVLIAVCLPLCIIMAAFADRRGLDAIGPHGAADGDRRGRPRRRQGTEPVARRTAAARRQAKDAAKRNLVAGEPLLLADADIQVGKSVQIGTRRDSSSPTAAPSRTPSASRASARKVRRRGPVDLLFAGVLGVDEFEPVEVATSTQLDRDICLVVDRSGSMMWTLIGRLEVSRRAPRNATRPTRRRAAGVRLATSVEAFLDGA